MLNINAIGFLKNVNPSFGSSVKDDKEFGQNNKNRQMRDIPSLPQPYFGAAKDAKKTTAQICDEIYAPLMQTENGKKGLELLRGLDDKFARKIYSGRTSDKMMFAIYLDALDEKSLAALGANIKTLNTLPGDYDYIIGKMYPFVMPKLLEREPEKLERSLNALKALTQGDLNLASKGGINDFLAGTNYSEGYDEFLQSYQRFKLGCGEMCITPEEGIDILLKKMEADENKD